MNYTRVPWQKAACRGWDTEMFFIEEGHIAAEVTPTLRDLCNDCPIFDKCFEYAVNAPSLHGFWAGTTVREREQFRARRRKQAWKGRHAS